MLFDVAGPFELSRHGRKRLITDQSLKDINPDAEGWDKGLSFACGCYVFAVRAGRGVVPFYVGQACRRPIAVEALNPSNREKYNKVLGDRSGTPLLFLLPMLTNAGKYRRVTKATTGLDSANFLEKWLIAAALERNPHLVNNKETRFLRQIHVVGIMNAKQGDNTAASQELRSALWS